MPNLPIFSQSSSIRESSQTPTTPNFYDSSNSISFNPSNSNTMLPFFFIPFTQNLQNPIVNGNDSHISSSPTPSLEEFFAKLDGEFAQFKNNFEDERITVDQIHDLTDIEFDQLGINKIGWRKAFRAAAQRYKK